MSTRNMSRRNKNMSATVRASSTMTSSLRDTESSGAIGYVQDLETNINGVEDMMRELAGGLTRIKSGIPELKASLENNEESQGLVKEIKEQATKKIDEAKEQIRQLEKEKQSLEAELGRVKQTLSKKDNNLEEVVEKLRKTEHDLSTTQTRLSEVMGNRLIDNNPEIADLSDQNRPSKLAEKYSELYDNEWTDAFEAIQEIKKYDETRCVENLLKMLEGVNTFCSEKWEVYMTTFRNDIKRGQDFQVPDFINKQLKDIAKSFAPRMVEDIYEEFTQALTTKWVFKSNAIKDYLKGCVEICWLMAAQDPPVVFNTNFKCSDTMDTNIFKAYTQTGVKIEFLVWPPMYLQEGGALLTKGVAQAIKTRRPESAPGRMHTRATDKTSSPTHTPRNAWQTIPEDTSVTTQPQGSSQGSSQMAIQGNQSYYQTNVSEGMQGQALPSSPIARPEQVIVNSGSPNGNIYSHGHWPHQGGHVGQMQPNYNQQYPNTPGAQVFRQQQQQQWPPAEHIQWKHGNIFPTKSQMECFIRYAYGERYEMSRVESIMGTERYQLCRDFVNYCEMIVKAGGVVPELR